MIVQISVDINQNSLVESLRITTLDQRFQRAFKLKQPSAAVGLTTATLIQGTELPNSSQNSFLFLDKNPGTKAGQRPREGRRICPFRPP